MPIKLERDDETQTDFAVWTRRYPGRGLLMLSKELETGEPVLILVPASNVGEAEGKRQVYRVKF